MQAAAFVGAKIWNSDIWPFLVNWLCTAERIRWESALRTYIPQLSILFVTVCTNAIIVTIGGLRITIIIADQIGAGDNTDVCPEWQTPCAATVLANIP